MDDLISRAKAIEALNKLSESTYEVDYVVIDCDDAIRAIEQLQPIKPEIVRCKDCKHWIPYDWMFNDVWQSKNMADYSEDEMGCELCDMSMKANDFCSRAERREVKE